MNTAPIQAIQLYIHAVHAYLYCLIPCVYMYVHPSRCMEFLTISHVISVSLSIRFIRNEIMQGVYRI